MSEVIVKLKSIDPGTGDLPLEYNAHAISDKITSSPSLRGIVSYYVTSYYNKVREQFSNLEDDEFSFDDLAATMRLAYLKFKRKNLSKDQIFDRLARWILKKEEMPEDYYEIARIIVAYFVQDCEVFEVENAK